HVWYDPASNNYNSLAVPDLSDVLAQVLPRRVVRQLGDVGWNHAPDADYVVLKTARARALAQALTDAGAEYKSWSWGTSIVYWPVVRLPEMTSIRIAGPRFSPTARDIPALALSRTASGHGVMVRSSGMRGLRRARTAVVPGSPASDT